MLRLRISILSALCALSFALCAGARAESATIEIQGVSAADAGKKEQKIPAALARFQNVLKGTVYSTFADAGNEPVKVSAGGKANASLGGYGVEVALVKASAGKAKVEVTLKKGGRPIGQPITTTLAKGEPVQVSQIGSKEAPTIFILVLKDSD